MKAVKSTDHVTFDEVFKTFKLKAGNSLYAFCITPELGLEHLYWGYKLEDGFDLRYLGESSRMAHFDTVEAEAINFDGKIVLEAETLEEIEKTWKENRTWKTDSTDSTDYVQKRRLENYSWRIMSKVTQAELRERRTINERLRRKSISVSFDPGDRGQENEIPQNVRRRSISNPLKTDLNIDLSDLHQMTKLMSDAPPTSPSQKFFEALNSQKAQLKKQGRHIFDRKIGTIGKSTLCMEYSDHGTGDFRSPSLIVVDNYNGSAISPLKYRCHQIFKGKLPMSNPNMPSVRCLDENEATTLVVTLVDSQTGLEVDLIYGKHIVLVY